MVGIKITQNNNHHGRFCVPLKREVGEKNKNFVNGFWHGVKPPPSYCLYAGVETAPLLFFNKATACFTVSWTQPSPAAETR